jgi:hypothetical protein
MTITQLFSADAFPKDARVLIETIFSLECKVLEEVQFNGMYHDAHYHMPVIKIIAQTRGVYSDSMNVSSLGIFMEDYIRARGPIPTKWPKEFGEGYELRYAPVYDFVAAYGERKVQPQWEIILSCRKKGINFSLERAVVNAGLSMDAIRLQEKVVELKRE